MQTENNVFIFDAEIMNTMELARSLSRYGVVSESLLVGAIFLNRKYGLVDKLIEKNIEPYQIKEVIKEVISKTLVKDEEDFCKNNYTILQLSYISFDNKAYCGQERFSNDLWKMIETIGKQHNNQFKLEYLVEYLKKEDNKYYLEYETRFNMLLN